jgi:2-C-methyl-D-erythritol 4-phosphate cytidylyltransferase
MIAAVIVAAGKGTRMGPNIDKLFLEVAGAPIVAHTWKRFDSIAEIDELILVVREGMAGLFRDLGREIGVGKRYRLVQGGRERQDSVWNGLQALADGTEIVVIQDAARPCTETALVLNTIAAAREAGAAVAAQKVTDTIKESDGGTLIARTLDRSKLWSVQTPQTFRVEVIRRALQAVRDAGLQITDDTAACERIGQSVRLVEGKGPNPKATSLADLPYIETCLSREKI